MSGIETSGNADADARIRVVCDVFYPGVSVRLSGELDLGTSSEVERQLETRCSSIITSSSI